MLYKPLALFLLSNTITSLTCEWYGSGYGVDINCQPGWAAFGLCSSGSRASCKDKNGGKYFYMLQCCKTKFQNYQQSNCQEAGHASGELSNCKSDDGYNQAIYGGCGSGRNNKCLVGGKFFTNAETCCDNGDISIADDADCGWKYGIFGDQLTCPEGMVMSGICGSAGAEECESGAVSSGTGIYCCPYSDNRN